MHIRSFTANLGVVHKLRWKVCGCFWPPTPYVDIFYLINVDMSTFLDYLPTCQRSLRAPSYYIQQAKALELIGNFFSFIIRQTWLFNVTFCMGIYLYKGICMHLYAFLFGSYTFLILLGGCRLIGCTFLWSDLMLKP